MCPLAAFDLSHAVRAETACLFGGADNDPRFRIGFFWVLRTLHITYIYQRSEPNKGLGAVDAPGR